MTIKSDAPFYTHYDQYETYCEGDPDFYSTDWDSVSRLQAKMDEINNLPTEEERDYFSKALLVEMYEL